MSGWKGFERRVARAHGCERAGYSGDRADVVSHPALSIECKLEKDVPAYLDRVMAQAESHADGKTPVCVLSRPRRPVGDAFVVVRLSDWLRLYTVRGNGRH